MPSAKYYNYLQIFQAKRLERDYKHLLAEPQYHGLAQFFLEDMYGPYDFHARDTQARRLHQFIHLAPGLSIEDIEVTLDLLNLTVRLDQQVADWLEHNGVALPFSEAQYEEAYYRVNSFEPRVRQIELINESLRRVHRLSRISLLGTALNNTKTFAKLMGMGELHRFLRRGYQALQPVQDLKPFLTQVTHTELDRLKRIYRLV
ncbi:hypothetical protein [Herpetosiphon sp. NSE202]|uniref:FFLEELY motif protein n=1 Tax=Herpetosiphon sp. NSE202 TaxID=3351349 RepID=UPI0036365AB5